MITNLSQFYNSPEWKRFRELLIAERTKEDGFVYDEHSGKPLLKNYDIVAHHKTPLTMQNVNDANIALNPENIMLVSQKSHNEIHARFGYSNYKKVYYVYGAPCAGKTTYVNNVKGNSDIIVDIDNIWECLTGTRYDKPNALKTNVFAIRDMIYDQIRTRAGKWQNAYVIEGGALKAVRMRQIDFLQAEGIFINTNKETCLKRLYGDDTRTEEQKQLWTGYIDNWFNDFQE